VATGRTLGQNCSSVQESSHPYKLARLRHRKESKLKKKRIVYYNSAKHRRGFHLIGHCDWKFWTENFRKVKFTGYKMRSSAFSVPSTFRPWYLLPCIFSTSPAIWFLGDTVPILVQMFTFPAAWHRHPLLDSDYYADCLLRHVSK